MCILQAHFDSLPISWLADDKVVDGARGKWCLPLVLDGIIYILEQQSFDLSRRRSFNQQRVLFECIWLVLQRKLTDSSPIFCRLLRARQAGDLEAVQAIVKVSFSESEDLWVEGVDAMRNQLLNEPCSKSARKFESIVHALCSHRALQQPAGNGSSRGASSSMSKGSPACLINALELAVCRAIALFANYTPTSTAEKNGWKSRGRGNCGSQHFAQLSLLGSMLAMAPDCDSATLAVLSCTNLGRDSGRGTEAKTRPVRRAKERAAASMGRYREADSDSEDEYVDDEEEDEEASVASEADDHDDGSDERDDEQQDEDGETEDALQTAESSPRFSPTDITKHPSQTSSQGKSQVKGPYHLRSPTVKGKGKGKGKAAMTKARSTGNLNSLSRRVNNATLATMSTDSELKKRNSSSRDSDNSKRWKRVRSADDASALDDYHHRGQEAVDDEDDDELEHELIELHKEHEMLELHKSFTGDEADGHQDAFTSDALSIWQSLADDEHKQVAAAVAEPQQQQQVASTAGFDVMLWQSLDRPEPALFGSPLLMHYPQVMPPAVYHHGSYYHRGPHEQMMYLPSSDYHEHRRVSPLMYPGYYAPVAYPQQPVFGGYPQQLPPPYAYNAGAVAGFAQSTSAYGGMPSTPISMLTEPGTTIVGGVASSSSSLTQDGDNGSASRAISPEVALSRGTAADADHSSSMEEDIVNIWT